MTSEIGIPIASLDAISSTIHQLKMQAHVLESLVTELHCPEDPEKWTIDNREGHMLAHFCIEQAKAIERLEIQFGTATGGSQR